MKDKKYENHSAVASSQDICNNLPDSVGIFHKGICVDPIPPYIIAPPLFVVWAAASAIISAVESFLFDD